MTPQNQNCELIPYLSISGAEDAINFYCQVFGVESFVRLDMPDGRVMHCEFRIGNARFFLSDELLEHGGTPSPKKTGTTTVAMHLYVDDCSETVNSMQQFGSEILMKPTDMFWGERFARVRDPFGHEWGIATVIREMEPNEIESAARKMFEEMPQDDKPRSTKSNNS
ncbi:MAG: VOC family protein [Planctomycetota bacterium]